MWLVFLIPTLSVFIAWYFYRHKLNWIEALVQIAIPVIFILVFKWIGTSYLTVDTEYWSSTTAKVEYHEPWNEYIHRTCTRTVSCGKDCTTTETYDCSYVEYHSAKWLAVDGQGHSHSITKKEYYRLKGRFGNKHFVDMHRSYHSQDGDKYVSNWSGKDKTLNIIVTEHEYENKVQASHSVFNYPDVSDEDRKTYKLFEYPKVTSNYKQDHLLGKADKVIERKLEILNARLGSKKQLKLFVLVFHDKPRMAGEMQEWLWKGGNKNEFIVAIGLSKSGDVQWCHPISWTEAQQTKINVRNFIESQTKIDWTNTVDFLYKEMKTNYKRKNFKDFNYLSVELTGAQVMWLYITTIIMCVGITIYVVSNDFDADDTLR